MATITAAALRQLPDSVDYDPLAHTTLDELAHTALIELDLIEEGQDGTVPQDAAKIRKWLKKRAPGVWSQR